MPDSHSLNVLDNIRVASPCAMNWEDMPGDERVRHCGDCDLNVYNFAEMNEAEIVALVTKTEGRVCGRLYRRADGTILTRDCPVGLRLVRQKMRRAAARIAAAVGLLMTGAITMGSSRSRSDEAASLRNVQPFAWVSEKLGECVAPNRTNFMLGAVALPRVDHPGVCHDIDD